MGLSHPLIPPPPPRYATNSEIIIHCAAGTIRLQNTALDNSV
jgi:hypothetical protein